MLELSKKGNVETTYLRNREVSQNEFFGLAVFFVAATSHAQLFIFLKNVCIV